MDDQQGVSESSEAAGDPWAVHVAAFRITKAQITATPLPASDEVLTVLTGMTLVVEEGRYEYLQEDATGAPAPSALVYGCYVREVGAPPTSSWIGTDAHIVITGTHENGWGVTIAGVGAIGRDEAGTLEISFERPPPMAVIAPEGSR